jgi:hypothetical protein
LEAVNEKIVDDRSDNGFLRNCGGKSNGQQITEWTIVVRKQHLLFKQSSALMRTCHSFSVNVLHSLVTDEYLATIILDMNPLSISG